VPSAAVFASIDAEVPFSSKETVASVIGVPAESRTVPETIIAGRGWVRGVWANAGTQFVGKKAANAAKNTASARIVDKEFTAGILLMAGWLARRVWGDTLGVLYRCEKKAVAGRGFCKLLKTQDKEIDGSDNTQTQRAQRWRSDRSELYGSSCAGHSHPGCFA
jgi:hypothetical protein